MLQGDDEFTLLSIQWCQVDGARAPCARNKPFALWPSGWARFEMGMGPVAYFRGKHGGFPASYGSCPRQSLMLPLPSSRKQHRWGLLSHQFKRLASTPSTLQLGSHRLPLHTRHNTQGCLLNISNPAWPFPQLAWGPRLPRGLPQS